MTYRDANGRFQKAPQIKSKTSASTPPVTPIPDFEKPLVSLNINNPFKRILYWLNEIRRKQTTTFAIKVSIPLIALPVVIIAVFTLGRYYGINFQKVQESARASSSAVPSETTPTPKPNLVISRAGTLRIAVGNETKYLLALRNGTLVVLDIPATIDLNKYKDKQVLVTGTLNSTTGVLKVTDIAEVQIFNPTV